MAEQPRSRRQTRAAILGSAPVARHFRPPLAKAVRLSERACRRILFDLKSEGLIGSGGGLRLISVVRPDWFARESRGGWRLLELTGQHLSIGVGGLCRRTAL